MLIIFIIISIFEVQYLASLQMGTLQMITKKKKKGETYGKK